MALSSSHKRFQPPLGQRRRKLIFTGPVELVGLGWGVEKQVFKVTVLLEYIDLCCSDKLIVPHAAIHVLYLYTKY